MSSILIVWLIIIVAALIIEVLTTTFYGLAVSLSALIVAFYVFVTGETDFTLIQGLVFLISTGFFSYFLPKMLVSKAPDMPQGPDRYLGMKRSVKKVGTDLKVSLDGVDYLVESDDELRVGDKVEITGHMGVSMKVKKVG